MLRHDLFRTKYVLPLLLLSTLSAFLIGIRICYKNVTFSVIESGLDTKEIECYDINSLFLIQIRNVFIIKMVHNNELLYSIIICYLSGYFVLLHTLKLFMCKHYSLYYFVEFFTHIIFIIWFSFSLRAINKKGLLKFLRPFGVEKRRVRFFIVKKMIHAIRLTLYALLIARFAVIVFCENKEITIYPIILLMIDVIIFYQVKKRNLYIRIVSCITWITFSIHFFDLRMFNFDDPEVFYFITRKAYYIMFTLYVGLWIADQIITHNEDYSEFSIIH